ncbi:MAG: hypothetical protein KGI58_03340 [Patescibacteria group bacterium]|nr:hypothetical protein [Patescibacteria group bacterium]
MSLIIEQNNNNIFKTKFTTVGGFIVTLLGLSILALAERILYDAGRLLVAPPLDYFDNMAVIVVHGIIIIFFLALALVTNMLIGPRKEKYAIALVPYYVVSIILSLQLLLQISVYFVNHHTTFEFYIVMLALIALCTYGIYYIQKRQVIKES